MKTDQERHQERLAEWKPKWWQNFEYCKTCPHRADMHDMNCIECCPVKRGEVTQNADAVGTQKDSRRTGENMLTDKEMTDKELLGLAADAAGVEHSGYCSVGYLFIGDGEKGSFDRWNPLEDDGDALRLAVKLGLLVHGNAAPTTVFCQVGERPDSFLEKSKPDPYAATRRAIVRAAAEIGKAMK